MQAVEAECNTLGALLKAMSGLLSRPQAAAHLFATEAQLLASTSMIAEVPTVVAAAQPMELNTGNIGTSKPESPVAMTDVQSLAGTSVLAGIPTAVAQPMDTSVAAESKPELSVAGTDMQPSEAQAGTSAGGVTADALADTVMADTAEIETPRYQPGATQNLAAINTSPSQAVAMDTDLIQPGVLPSQLADTSCGATYDASRQDLSGQVQLSFTQATHGTTGQQHHMVQGHNSMEGADHSLALKQAEEAQTGAHRDVPAVSTAAADRQLEQITEPVVTAGNQKPTADQQKLTAATKTARSKAANRELSRAAKAQLTGSAALAMAVMEAGSKPVGRARSEEDAGGRTCLCLSESHLLLALFHVIYVLKQCCLGNGCHGSCQ